MQDEEDVDKKDEISEEIVKDEEVDKKEDIEKVEEEVREEVEEEDIEQIEQKTAKPGEHEETAFSILASNVNADTDAWILKNVQSILKRKNKKDNLEDNN